MHITCVIASLSRGGSERVLSTLASAWVEHGHEVSILTFRHDDAQSYAPPPGASIDDLGLSREPRQVLDALYQNIRRIRILRRAIRASKPDVVISFLDQTNILVLLATRRLRIPVIVSERVDPLHYDIGPVWRNLRRAVYPFADMLVCQTEEALARFQAMISVRGIAIANPVIVSSGDGQSTPKADRSEGRSMIAMGRLVRQKGFDRLLEAFARVATDHQDWTLTIIGKGPLRDELAQQARVLGLAGRVSFAGEMADPFPVLRAGDLFVFSSRFEGFGMALAEAMACGLPAVSFDCPEGPRGIILDGIDGILVPPDDVAAFAAALDRLMGDDELRARLAACAPEVLNRFSVKRAMSMWGDLFARLGLTSREPAVSLRNETS